MSEQTLESAVMDVTPARAEKWLKKNHPENRPIAWSRVESFVNDMVSGNWRLTHQGICFDGDGWLIDGQHRLHAIVKSGMTVRLCVATNRGAQFHDPIDRGGPRSVAVVTGIHPRVTSALALLHRMEQGTINDTTPVTVAETLVVNEHHRPWLDAIMEHPGVQSRRSLIAGVRAACVWTMPIDQDATMDFLVKVQSGEMIARGDPAFAFRKWREKAVGANSNIVLYAALNCLRHAINGATMTSVYTGESGYRGSVARRRALKVPYTPGTNLVTGISWSAIKDTPQKDEAGA